MRRMSAWGAIALLLGLGIPLNQAMAAGGGDDLRRLAHFEAPDDAPGPYRVWSPGGPLGRAPQFGRFFPIVQVNVDQWGNNIPGDAANEPSIAVDPTNPDRLVIGWRQFDTINSNFRQAGVAYSHDGGMTWHFDGPLDPGNFRSDPILHTDTNGRFYYNSLGTNFLCDFFTSDDGGVTWSFPQPAWGGDKAWFVIDNVSDAGLNNIYNSWSIFFGCCENDVFTRSLDDGASYTYPVRILGDPIFGTLAVGTDGEVYVAGAPSGNFSLFTVSKSIDAYDPEDDASFVMSTVVDLGGSMTLSAGPNPGGLLGQAWVATDTSDGPYRGNVYLLCSVDPPGSDPLDVHFSRSTDGGLTWSDPIRVNDDPLGNEAWQWFGTMSVAPNGRIDVIWNDTRNDPSGNESVLYRSCSYDGGLTFTTNLPLTQPFNHFLGYPQQNKLGDYYDMVSDEFGADIAFAATFNGEQDVYYLRSDFDCNHNGVPDDQDIFDGTSADCNENGLPDECDVAYGIIPDGNENGIPDECETCTVAKLLPADAGEGDTIGLDLSASGPRLIVGAGGDDDNGDEAGAAYMYRYDGINWSEETKLLASDGEAGDAFGASVGVDGDVAIVGAYGDDDVAADAGAAYLYRYDGSSWIEEAKLTAGDGQASDYFGYAVGVSGDAAIVSAYRDDDQGTESGAAYIFRYDGAAWSQQAKLLAFDGAPADLFGIDADISGDLAIVGAAWNDEAAPNAGAAYLFRFDGSQWITETKLTASDGADDDSLGWSVAVYTDTESEVAVAGAYFDDDFGSKSGAAYVYRHESDPDQWVESKLVPTDGAAFDRFGRSVAIEGDAILVGAYGDSNGGTSYGSAYAFGYDGSDWIQEAKLLADDGAETDFFGVSVALSGDFGFAGAYHDDDAGLDSGSAYIFAGMSDADCNGNDLPDACDIINGFSEDANANGIPDECECPADVNGDQAVDIDDVFAVLDAWGACDGCPEDVNADGLVDIDDIFAVLGSWGPC